MNCKILQSYRLTMPYGECLAGGSVKSKGRWGKLPDELLVVWLFESFSVKI